MVGEYDAESHRLVNVRTPMFAHLGPEALLVSLALLVALVRPQLGASWFAKAERALAAVARRRTLSVLPVSCTSMRAHGSAAGGG